MPEHRNRRIRIADNQLIAHLRVGEHQRYPEPASLATAEVKVR